LSVFLSRNDKTIVVKCQAAAFFRNGALGNFQSNFHKRGAMQLGMSVERRLKSPIIDLVVRANTRVQSLVASDPIVSLEELQGAVEYLLDTVKAARDTDGSVALRARKGGCHG
jgi:hypothetical protein